MAGKKHSSLDRVLGRLDTLDPVNLANLVQRLAKERALFEQIFKTLQEGVLVIDADGAIEYANEAAHRLIGLSGDVARRQDALAADPGAAPHAGRRTRGRRPASSPGSSSSRTRSRARCAFTWCRSAADEGGAERRHAVILADVTLDRQTTEQRIEDERTSSILLLAAGVAHELGNPLNSLTIHLQLMARKLKKLGTLARGQVGRRVGRGVPRGGRAP